MADTESVSSGPPLSTTVLVPVDATDVRVVSWSSTDPHAGITATIGDGEREHRLTIDTITRTGERFSPTGYAHGVATDARTLAASCVWKSLASRLPPITSEADRAAARAAAEEIERQAEAAAEALADPARWSLRPVVVDGVEFVLHVHPFPDGFAGFADLGPEVLTLGGSAPEGPLRLRRRRTCGEDLLPDDDRQG